MFAVNPQSVQASAQALKVMAANASAFHALAGNSQAMQAIRTSPQVFAALAANARAYQALAGNLQALQAVQAFADSPHAAPAMKTMQASPQGFANAVQALAAQDSK